MKVQCFLCAHEKNGFCTKKKKNGVPIKIKLKKRRMCDMFSQDPFKKAKELKRQEEAKKIPFYVPTYRYYMTKKERKEKGVDDGPLFVRVQK